MATAGVIAADLVGATMMIPKTWRDPNSETLVTYVLAGVSGALATAAVAAPDPALLLYPAYFALINAAIAAMIVQRTVALRVST